MRRQSLEVQQEEATNYVLENIARGYNKYNPYEVGGLLQKIFDWKVSLDNSIKKKLLEEFYHLNAEDSHGYDARERGMHSSYYAAALAIAKELDDTTKVEFFDKRWHFARSSERDGEIADYMMDSMWGL